MESLYDSKPPERESMLAFSARVMHSKLQEAS